MLKLVLNRFGLGVLTLFAVSVLIFVCTQILPGDVASAVLQNSATPESLAEMPHGARARPARLCALLRLAVRRRCTAISASRSPTSATSSRRSTPRFVNTLFLAGYAAIDRRAAGGRPRPPGGDPAGRHLRPAGQHPDADGDLRAGILRRPIS